MVSIFFFKDEVIKVTYDWIGYDKKKVMRDDVEGWESLKWDYGRKSFGEAPKGEKKCVYV